MAKTIKRYLPALLILGWVVFVFRSLILNPIHALLDWGDSSYIAWQIYMLRDRILSFAWSSLPNLNQHYPYPLSTFYSDSFLGQAVMTIPFFFIKNPVLLYNLTFFITLLLNYLTGYWFFKQIGKGRWAGFVGTFLLNNSFYFFDQLIHLQTISYWPTLLLLYFLNLSDEDNRLHPIQIVLAAFFLGWQFYLSVYLGIFSLVIFAVYAVIKIAWLIIFRSKWQLIGVKLVQLVITGGLAALFIIPLYLQYKLFEQLFHQVRDINEILINSTHITDFLFFVPYTLLAKIPPVARFQLFNHHVSAEAIRFPGLVLLIGTLTGLLLSRIKTNLKQAHISFEGKVNFLDFFFLAILLVGLVFALGPRLNANGQYLELPLPYLIFLNKIHVFSSIRLVHRWIFLTLLSLVYFSTKFYPRLPKFLLFGALAWFIFESVPLNMQAENRPYLDQGHLYLAGHATATDSLLEFPFLNLEKGVPVDYETRVLMASTKHKLQLMNGYTGLFITDQGNLRLTLEKFLPDSYSAALLNSLGFDYLKVNKRFLPPERVRSIFDWYQDKVVFNDPETLIIRLGSDPNPKQISKLNVEFIKKDPLTFGTTDKLVYLRLKYHNPATSYIANLVNRKTKLKFRFYRDNHLVTSRVYLDLYPLVNSPRATTIHLVKFKESAIYDRVEVDLFRDSYDINPFTTLKQ